MAGNYRELVSRHGQNFRRSNFSEDHRDKTDVPDPFVAEDLISSHYTVKGYIFQYFGRYGLPSSGCHRETHPEEEGRPCLPKYC